MDAYTPDLSGVDLAYYVTTYQRTIFKAPQKLLFDIPVFHNETFEVIKLGTIPTTLVEGEDYLVQVDDIHVDAISVCKSIDPSFNKTLLKSVTIIKHNSADYRVQVKYNQLFVDVINYARINKDRDIELTPDLIGNMVEQLDYLQQVVLNRSDAFSVQSAQVKLLNEDPAGTDPDNHIVDERHNINTLGNIRYIRPIYGAFFKDSLVIKNPLTNAVLVEGTDYEVTELDIAKTKTTANQSGVYRTIIIKCAYAGEIGLNYQAYGGSTDVASIRKINDRIESVERHLAENSFITPKTLAADPTMIALRNKLQEMDGTMRLLLSNGLPSYGDVSTGTAVMKKVHAADAEVHWWNIATLYRVDGSNDDILADVFKFRLKTLYTGMMFECSVSVNLTNPLAKRITVDCINSNLPHDALEKITPKLRALEVTTGGVYSGVVLQLGMRLGSGLLQETFVIEDMSGRESCWKLVPFNAQSVSPEDTSVLMPNGSAVFTYGSEDSIATELGIPFTVGLNLLNANSNIPLSNSTVVTTERESVVQQIGSIDVSIVKSFMIKTIVDIAGPNPPVISVNIPISQWDNTNKSWMGTTEVVIGEDVYSLSCRLYYDPNLSIYAIDYRKTDVNVTNSHTMNITETKLIF